MADYGKMSNEELMRVAQGTPKVSSDYSKMSNEELMDIAGQRGTKRNVWDKAESLLGKTYDLIGGDLVQKAGVARPLVEAGLKTASGFVPGGQAAAEPFFKSEPTRATMGVGAGLATAPAVTIGGLAGGFIGQAVAPERFEKLGGLAGSLVGGGVGGGVGQVARNISPKIAGGIINSMIKPKSKAFQYGKNPGQEVARLGIKGNSLPQFGQKIQNKIVSLENKLLNIGKTSNKKVDLQPSLEPIYATLKELKQNPRSNSAIITKVQNLLDDVIGINRNAKGQIISKKTLKGVSVKEAINTKRGIGKIAKFTGTDDPPAYQGLVHKVYHLMKTQIEKSAPETASINSSIANLIGASKAIPNAIAAAEKTPMAGLLSVKSALAGGLGALSGGGPAGALAGIGASKALQAPVTGTRLASLLGKRAPQGVIRSLLKK